MNRLLAAREGGKKPGGEGGGKGADAGRKVPSYDREEKRYEGEDAPVHARHM